MQNLVLVFHYAMQNLLDYSCLSIIPPSVTKLNLKYRISFMVFHYDMQCLLDYSCLTILLSSITKLNLTIQNFVFVFYNDMHVCRIIPVCLFFLLLKFSFGISQCYAISTGIFLSVFSS